MLLSAETIITGIDLVISLLVNVHAVKPSMLGLSLTIMETSGKTNLSVKSTDLSIKVITE